jgi:hypothetical protein
MIKTVNIVGHEFDALPGHVVVNGRGSGSNLRSATCAALRAMLKDQRLRGRHIGSFKLSVVVIAERAHEPESQTSKHCDAGAMNDMRFGDGGE